MVIFDDVGSLFDLNFEYVNIAGASRMDRGGTIVSIFGMKGVRILFFLLLGFQNVFYYSKFDIRLSKITTY